MLPNLRRDDIMISTWFLSTQVHTYTKTATHSVNFLSLNFWQERGCWKSFSGNSLHPGWALQTASSAAALLPPLLRNLHHYSGGQCEHDHTDWAHFSPENSYVLFPQQPVLHWPLPFHCNYPQNAGKFCEREEHHLLPWMHDSALLFLFFCHFRVSHAGCNGIWPLCCHLQSFTLQCHHVSSSLLLAHNGSLYVGFYWVINSHRFHVETHFVQDQCD